MSGLRSRGSEQGETRAKFSLVLPKWESVSNRSIAGDKLSPYIHNYYYIPPKGATTNAKRNINKPTLTTVITTIDSPKKLPRLSQHPTRNIHSSSKKLVCVFFYYLCAIVPASCHHTPHLPGLHRKLKFVRAPLPSRPVGVRHSFTHRAHLHYYKVP